MLLADLLAPVDALALKARRHADVGHHHVGCQFASAEHECVEVLAHADDLEVLLATEHRSDALTDEDRVIGQEHGDPILSHDDS